MPTLKVRLVQSGNDSAREISVPTGMVLDGKAGWQVNSLRTYWSNINSILLGSRVKLDAAIQTEGGTQNREDPDLIAMNEYNIASVGASSGFYQLEGFMISHEEPRVTVQPNLVFRLASSNTSQANNVLFELDYSIVRLTDIEVMRLYAGGA